MKEFDLSSLLTRLRHEVNDSNKYLDFSMEGISENDHIKIRCSNDLTFSDWRKSPFPILVCMPFHMPPIVPYIWETHIKPFVSSIGQVIRIDWTTNDWVDDFRLAASDAAFVLLDLTSTRGSVIREMKYLLDEDIPVMAYMNCTVEEKHRNTVLGKVYPQLVVKDGQGTVDDEIFSFPIRIACYDDYQEVEQLCEYIRKTLLPIQDMIDPSASYIGTDISQMTPQEQEGFALARVPRSRIIAMSERLSRETGKDYWIKAQEMMLKSAIYRARVFVWLGNPNILLHTAENLWIRMHLVWGVLQNVRAGYMLTSNEIDAIHCLMSRETDEDIRLQCLEILTLASSASVTPPALKHGMPSIPPRLQQDTRAMRIHLRMDLRHDFIKSCLMAKEWKNTFPDSIKHMKEVLFLSNAAVARPRCFKVEARNGGSTQNMHLLGQIEDCLDACVPALRSFSVKAQEAKWNDSEIADLIRTIISICVLKELERQKISKRDESSFIALRNLLSYVWGLDTSDLCLFEFQSNSQRTHFRGLLSWSELKELVGDLYAKIVSPMIHEKEEDVCRSILSFNFPPSQAWDIIIVNRWRELLQNPITRRIWCRFAIPSAFFCNDVERIFLDPQHVDRWGYVLLN